MNEVPSFHLFSVCYTCVRLAFSCLASPWLLPPATPLHAHYAPEHRSARFQEAHTKRPGVQRRQGHSPSATPLRAQYAQSVRSPAPMKRAPSARRPLTRSISPLSAHYASKRLSTLRSAPKRRRASAAMVNPRLQRRCVRNTPSSVYLSTFTKHTKRPSIPSSETCYMRLLLKGHFLDCHCGTHPQLSDTTTMGKRYRLELEGYYCLHSDTVHT